ncbi:translation initiation factor IF-3 [Goekera deserti]|uniref:translation initiation factor IF-3 n=1 Tax=Goekera deserti TaxID=2497753 RepID=UPI001F3BEDD5|nr:translation initiation factor IF-3 [Goekera deserti]
MPGWASDSSPQTATGEAITEPRINDRIRVPEVRLVGPEGEQVGIVSIGEALRLAQDSELDLVEVAPMARPPVVKLMDYGKFKYESAQKAREAKRNQALTVIKEMRLRLKIDPHDYETKKGHVERFLKSGDKVKITVMFRGREQSRPEMGYRLLQRLAGDVSELGVVESNPKQDGRNMVMVIAPHRNAQLIAQQAQQAAQADRRSAKEAEQNAAAQQREAAQGEARRQQAARAAAQDVDPDAAPETAAPQPVAAQPDATPQAPTA